LKRVAATRFFYKRFLLGEIYLGRTSKAYVLPDTWRWFADDLRESHPIAYARVGERSAPGGNPFADFIAHNFEPVFANDDFPVSLRHDVAREVLLPSASRDWKGRPPDLSPSGWIVDGNDARYAKGPSPSADEQLTLSTGSCFRLDGMIRADAAGTLGGVVFRFTDNAGKNERLKLSFNSDNAVSGSDFVDYLSSPSGVRPGARTEPFSLVVGRRSAVLVIEHRVRAALLLPKSVTVTAEPTSPALELSRLEVGAAPTGSGC
jgi:hypothetical protein